MLVTDLREHLVNGGRIERDGARVRLTVPPTAADAYTDAQLDDYPHEPPRHFRHRPPQHLAVRARFSSNELKGTAGFGFWNHPFSREGNVIDPPCNVWFFHGSPESDMQIVSGVAGHGFKAAVLNSYPSANSVVARATGLLTRLGSPILNWMLRSRALSGLVLSAARAAVNADEALLDVDMTAWHDYEIKWQRDVAVLTLDGREVLRARRPPLAALGFVAWIDNYRATAATGQAGDGHVYEFAYVDVKHEQWLELEILHWQTPA